jgi:hypothetical protein
MLYFDPSIRERLKEDVTNRLRRVCCGWNECEFEALVEEVIQVRLKYPTTMDVWNSARYVPREEPPR